METIRKTREKLGLSQRELAKISGVPRSTIFNMETGQSQPKFETLLAVVVALAEMQ